ncbi:pseudouridine-5-phosphate glycosidase [candidate division KSB3 bacterium]|uniref:Pseudouridine-5'-phosphate glycosidase n=1 Tax=candidate division KSB3 bacterium TaxID=2044937 RepID=A0A2G6E8G2_9BACT|nr:MAG: pseudouridine-5-phosphate glycosidase [candidate division KSB3 bacterium]PIE30675.1 MAG: pseudouridine-5-phosphate glycosidase [candidate division KSB3 bacterium]
MQKYLICSDDVQHALDAGLPVVALESTIISHGMPYPDNLKTAKEVEQIVSETGAMPATIAIIDGDICVGLSEEQMQLLATEKHIVKASRRDLPIVLSKKLHASTTVAATMICAKLAGIDIFVTGGIGGVHRHAEKTFDISADLQELAKTDVAVISAGAKAILDLKLTMEYLETMGVPTLSYQSDEFPAFYTRHSGIPAGYRVESPEEIARIIHTKWELGLEGGLIIGNPIPEEDSMDPEEMQKAVDCALRDAREQGIEGKEVTPFLLDRMKVLTRGESLGSNIALIKNNARLGAEVAVALQSLKG